MVSLAILTLVLVADATSVPDLSNAQLAARAEAWFQEGVRLRNDGESGQKEFQAAAASYEELRQRDAANSDLYRNLGHAYVLADDLPNAILSFRRGLRLAPQNGDLHDSLAAARALVIYLADDPLGRPIPEPRPVMAAEWLFLADLFGYAVLCACLTRWLMTRRYWLLIAAAICLITVAAMGGSLVDAEHRRPAATGHSLVVINDDGVLLRKGDSLTYPPRYDTPVNRGVEARLIHQRQDWVQIELAGGEIGWVPLRFVLID